MTTVQTKPRYGMKPTLPSRYYWAEEVYQQEKERVFYDSWFCIGREHEIPNAGDFLARMVADESIVVVRDKTGEIHAFYNVCRHRGNRLCTKESGRFKGGAVACGYHGWTYALNGDLLATPNMADVEGFDKGEFPLYRVAVQLWHGFIMVNLSESPQAFNPELGEIGSKLERYNLTNLRAAHREVYDVRANWKVILENNVECFHCPGVHPELCEIVPSFGTGIIGQGNPDGALLIEGGNTFAPQARTGRPPISTTTEADHGRFRSLTIYPNLFLGLLPDHAFALSKWPTGPKETRIIVDWLFEPETIEAPAFDPSDTVRFLDIVLRQDWDICEQVQKGLQSRAFKAGVYSPQEHLPYKFNQWILERLER